MWGTLFFVFMSFAALSTVIAVFEGILRFSMDQWGWSRKRAVTVNLIAIPLLSLPCALGFNVLSDVVMPGVGDIQTVEDFLVSSNIMPLGSLVYVLFCVSRRGWGWKNFLAEANEGEGLKFPRWLRLWMRFGVPVLVVIILIMGWVPSSDPGCEQSDWCLRQTRVFVRLGIAGFRVFVRRRQTFLKNGHKIEFWFFMRRSLRSWRQLFTQNVIWKALENADPAV